MIRKIIDENFNLKDFKWVKGKTISVFANTPADPEMLLIYFSDGSGIRISGGGLTIERM